MSDIGSWEPDSGFELDEKILARLLRAASDLTQDELSFSAGEIRALAPVMTLNAALWQSHAGHLPADQLLALIRLFTLAESRLAGWEAGDTSPVIPLVALLKQRGQCPEDLAAWIKSHSENRFLPYGNLLHRL